MMKFILAVIAVAMAALGAAKAGNDPLFPDVIQWGASTADIEKALQGKCANGFKTRPIDPHFLPDVKNAQVQVDCDGYDFMGAPRWVEFVIGDDRLQMVWLMVEAQDQGKIVDALEEAYGAPSGKNEMFIAFTQNRTAWRHEPPEILYYAPELDDWIGPWIQGGE